MMMKAALMARVSSDEQAKGYSLDVQLDSLRKYCESNSLIVSKVFKEDHSAKTFDRPEFISFLKHLKKNKGSIDLLLFTSWDRFSRNAMEAYRMIDELKKYGVQAQAIEQPIDLSIPENKLMLAVYLAIPEIDNDRRSIKTIGGIRGARKAGRITCTAPRGYSNKRDERNKPIIVPNEQAMHVANAFELVASGTPMEEIRKELAINGVKVSKSQIYVMFKNPIYYGMIRVPAGENEKEYYTKGIHEPIISEILFNKVQDVLAGRRLATNRQSTLVKKAELPLRGVLICDNCRNHITGSASRSQTGKKHFYYHCNHCKKQRYQAEKANELVENLLKDLSISKDYKRLYHSMVSDYLGVAKDPKSEEKRIKEIKAQIQVEKMRLDNLQDMFVDNKISHEDYSNLRRKYETKKLELEQVLTDKKELENTIHKRLESSLQKVSNLADIYQNADLKSKSKLLSSIFPEKFSFDGKKCRTTKINELIRQAVNMDKGFKGTKKRQLSNNLELSYMVVSTGIEPVSNV